MTYTLSPVYTADTTEAGLVLHIPKNTDPSCGAIEFTSFPESMSNKLKENSTKIMPYLKITPPFIYRVFTCRVQVVIKLQMIKLHVLFQVKLL